MLDIFPLRDSFNIKPAINVSYKKPHTPICFLHPFNNNNSRPTKSAKVKAQALSNSREAKVQTTDQPKATITILEWLRYNHNSDNKDNHNIMLVISKFFLGTLVSPVVGYSLLFFLLQCIKRKNRIQSESIPENVSGPDVIIVGAGVAGSALAYTLGKDGRKVHVIERDLTKPDRIVGELLQPGGYLKLVELGLRDCVQEIDAQPVLGYVIYKNGKTVKLPYPLEKFRSDVAGWSFHNGRFIQKMREKASTLTNVLFNQGTATSLIEENGTIRGVQYKTKAGEELQAYAPLTIVCDGCFSNLRRSLCKSKVEVPSCFVGLIIKNCNLPFPNHGHVILADPSLILFYRISSTEIRCMVNIPGQKLPSIANGEMANYLKTTVAPQIPPELHDAFISAIDDGNIRTMPNRVMPADPKPTQGALLLGDALNMRHPLSGGGMMVALSDIVVLRDLLKQVHDLRNANSLCRCIESFYILRKPMASIINTVAGVTYKVLSSSPDAVQQEIQQLCLDYLNFVSIYSSEPVALFSGLSTGPLSLALNSFFLAAYGVGHLLSPFPSPERLLLIARLISRASAIIFPIIQAEEVMHVFFPDHIPLLSLGLLSKLGTRKGYYGMRLI